VPNARDRNPDSGIAITSAIRYEVWTQDTSLELADRPAWMSVSEAVMELDLTGAACIVFQHGGSGRVNIIYRRTDGNVGWVDPPSVNSGANRD